MVARGYLYGVHTARTQVCDGVVAGVISGQYRRPQRPTRPVGRLVVADHVTGHVIYTIQWLELAKIVKLRKASMLELTEDGFLHNAWKTELYDLK